MLDPEGVRALTFDCYGTLIDWEAGIRGYVEPILRRSRWQGVSTEAWLAAWEPIQFGMLHPYRPYREILIASYEATMRALGLETFADAGPGLVRSMAEWQPFPDVVPALRRLARRYRLAIVSNVDRDLLADTVAHLRAPFSALVTAEDAQAYKPDRKPLELALERLALPGAHVLHAAFGWRYDLAPARAVGMKTAFVNRARAPRPDGVECDLEVPTLGDLAGVLGV
jgi:2-haloacid dehalogenase